MSKQTVIIILNWNGVKNTIECIHSLLLINLQQVKIMVIDNGSIEDEAEILKREFGANIDVFQLEENNGFTGGCNYGIEKARELYNPEYYLLLNNDTVVRNNFLDKLIETAASDERIGIVGPVIYDYYKHNKLLFSGGDFNWILGKTYHKTLPLKKTKRERFITGCCFLIKKEVVDAIGLLDDDFFAYFEDAAYCLSAQKIGFRCVCEPKAIVYHNESSSLGRKSTIYTYLFSRNRILFINKYTSQPYKLYFFIFNFFKLLCVLVFFRISNQNQLANAFLKGYIDGNKGMKGEPAI